MVLLTPLLIAAPPCLSGAVFPDLVGRLLLYGAVGAVPTVGAQEMRKSELERRSSAFIVNEHVKKSFSLERSFYERPS